MFGEGGNAAERRAALRKRASLLDSFTSDLARLKRELGPGDRARVSQYLDTVREVERRIQKAELSVSLALAALRKAELDVAWLPG